MHKGDSILKWKEANLEDSEVGVGDQTPLKKFQQESQRKADFGF